MAVSYLDHTLPYLPCGLAESGIYFMGVDAAIPWAHFIVFSSLLGGVAGEAITRRR